MTEPVYPPHHSWFAQRQTEDGEWATYAPTHDRNKARDRVRTNRAEDPKVRHRLIKVTESYEVDDES